VSILNHYTLEKAASLLRASPDEILQNAVNGTVTLSFIIKSSRTLIFDYKELGIDEDGQPCLTTIIPHYHTRPVTQGSYIPLSQKLMLDIYTNKTIFEHAAIPADENSCYFSHDPHPSNVIHIDELVITREEFERFKTTSNQLNNEVNSKKPRKQDLRESIFSNWLKDQDKHQVSLMKKEDVLKELRRIDPHLFMGDQKHFFRLQKLIAFKSGRKSKNGD
jgi:hypothetical protein